MAGLRAKGSGQGRQAEQPAGSTQQRLRRTVSMHMVLEAQDLPTNMDVIVQGLVGLLAAK